MSWMGLPQHTRLLRSSWVEMGSSADSSHRGHPPTPRTCRRGHPPTPLTCKRRSHPPAPHICPRVSSCRGHMSSCLGFYRVPVQFPHICPRVSSRRGHMSSCFGFIVCLCSLSTKHCRFNTPLMLQGPYRMVKELHLAKASLHDSLHPSVRAVLLNKRRFVCLPSIVASTPLGCCKVHTVWSRSRLVQRLNWGPSRHDEGWTFLLRKWNELVKVLHLAKASLHDSLHPSVRAVLLKKRRFLLTGLRMLHCILLCVAILLNKRRFLLDRIAKSLD